MVIQPQHEPIKTHFSLSLSPPLSRLPVSSRLVSELIHSLVHTLQAVSRVSAFQQRVKSFFLYDHDILTVSKHIQYRSTTYIILVWNIIMESRTCGSTICSVRSRSNGRCKNLHATPPKPQTNLDAFHYITIHVHSMSSRVKIDLTRLKVKKCAQTANTVTH